MRWCVSVGAVLVAGAIVGGDVAGIAAPSPKSRFAETKHNVPSVNVELVIAVDVSYSMDMDELAIQREGYAQAIVSKDFLQALRAGPGSKVAVTYFEWSLSGDEKIIIPWRVIDGPGAFIMTIKDREKFQEAIRTKLVLEVAGLTPERRIVPAAEKEPRVPCLIGEKEWQERRGR